MTNTIGRYELRGELGQGGMATVYRAYDAMLNREVALKVMAGHLSTDVSFQRRFEREARVIATLEHPNIVPVYDYGTTAQGQPYLVMRLLRGGTLYDRLAAGALTQQKLLAIMKQVASALDYAHDRDIIHRDVKPFNVLFDEKGNAYVSDFGIAKVRDATTNLTGNAIVGTAAYMSPEQFMGATIDGRSDQYSLAVVLFEALSGRAPFVSDTLHGLMFMHINEPPPDVHSLNRSLTPAMSVVLRRALAKDPRERFPTVSDFVQMLDAAGNSRQGAADDGLRRQLQDHYDTGLKAYQHSDWATAVDFLGRVIALDTGYRNAAQLHQTARFRLQEQQRGTPPTVVMGGDVGGMTARYAPPGVAAPGAAAPYVPGAGGVVQPAPQRATRWPLLLGLLALLIAGGLAAFFLLRPSPEPTAPAASATTSAGATAVVVVAHTTAPTATPEPTVVTPTPVLNVPLIADDPTAAPTDEPTATQTRVPTATTTRAPTATATPAGGSGGTFGTGSNTVALGPGGGLDFENFGLWTRGDQDNGTLTQSTAQARSGSRSAALEYDFPTADNDYVVFIQPHDIEGQPNQLRLWVHGNGSGHYLNAWIVDADNERWSVPFGRVTHQGWKEMIGRIDEDQKWPWGRVGGNGNNAVDYPIRFYALVLDDSPDTFTGTGTIYLDDLTAGTGQAASAPGASTSAPGASTPASGTATPTAAPTGGVGAILFTAGDSLLTVDPGGQPRILGTATRNTCSALAEAGGVTYNVVAPGPGCATVGDGQALCASPNGDYQVLMGRPEGGTRNVTLISPANPNGDFIFNRAVDPSEGILWAPNGNSFLIVVGDEVVQVFIDRSFRTVVSSVPAVCPRWSAGP